MTFGWSGAIVGTVPLGIAASAFAQVLGKAPDDAVSITRIVTTLALCLTLAVGVALLLKARGSWLTPLANMLHRDKRIQLVEVVRLTQHVDLCLVRLGETTLVLAASASGVDVLPCPDDLTNAGNPETKLPTTAVRAPS